MARRKGRRSSRVVAAGRRADGAVRHAPGAKGVEVLAAVALVCVTLVAYWPAMQGGFIWDDDDYVTRNVALRSLDGLRRIWLEPGAVPQYYPLTFSTLWLNYQLTGAAPGPYHVTNVLLHALAAVLLWRVCRRLDLPGAWLVAGVFALHPVHVESVAWVSERKNVLSGALALGSLLAYLRWLGWSAAGDATRQARGAYPLALALFALALFAKTVTCTLPVVIALLLWWKRGRVTAADVRPLLPMLALGLVLGAMTVWMEQQHVGARGVAWDFSSLERTLIAGRALWFYAATLAWPSGLTFVYPRWTIDVAQWWQYLFPLAALATAVVLMAARRRIGRGAFTAAACFAVTLAPALGFVDVYPMRYTFVADHYQYLASIALIALAVGAAARWVTGRSEAQRRAAMAVGGALLAVLGALTWRQGPIYADEGTLWRDTIAKNPGAIMAYINLGMFAQQNGRSAEAVEHLQGALRLDPADAEVHDNLGIAYASLGDLGAARTHFETAIRLAPGTARTYSNLGNLFARQGSFGDAIAHYEQAIALAPGYADPRNNLANVLVYEGRVDEAIVQYRAALAIDPGYVDAHYNLGTVLAERGESAQAVLHFEAALERAPGHAKASAALAELRRR